MKNVKQNKKNLSYLTLKYMQNVELMMNSSRSFHNVKSSVHAPNSVPSYTLSICVYFNEIIFCHCRMAFNVSPALPQYHSNCSLPSRPLRSAHSFNSCHQELRMERSLVFMMILLYSWVHIYSNAYFCYKLMLLYPHMVYRAHTLKTNCNRDAICAETSCHSPPAASEAHLNVRGLCCLKKKQNPNTIGSKCRPMNMTTNRSPRKRSSTSLKHSAARTNLKTVSFLFFPRLISIWRGGEKQEEWRGSERNLWH